MLRKIFENNFYLVRKQFFLIIFILFLIAFNAFGQEEKYLIYPIQYLNLTGTFEGQPSAKLLFHSGFLLNTINESNNSIICKLEKSDFQKDNVTYLLSLSIDKNKLINFTIVIEFDDFEEVGTMVYFKARDLTTGESTVVEYNGTEKSLGEIVGGFSSMANYMFNLEKINTILSEWFYY